MKAYLPVLALIGGGIILMLLVTRVKPFTLSRKGKK